MQLSFWITRARLRLKISVRIAFGTEKRRSSHARTKLGGGLAAIQTDGIYSMEVDLRIAARPVVEDVVVSRSF